MTKYIESIIDFIISPSTIYKEIEKPEYSKISLLVFLGCIFTQSLSHQVWLISSGKQSGFGLLYGFLFSILILASLVCTYAAWIHFITSLSNKPGNVRNALKIWGLSFSPVFLCLPLSILIVWIKPPWIISTLLSIIILILFLRLVFWGIKGTYSLSSIQTVLVLVSPLILIFIVFISFIILVIGVMIGASLKLLS